MRCLQSWTTGGVATEIVNFERRKEGEREGVAQQIPAGRRPAGCEWWERRRVKNANGRGTIGNNGSPTLPTRAAPAEGTPRTSGAAFGNDTRPGAFLGDARGGVTCGACSVALQHGHRAVHLSNGNGRHVLHARDVAEIIARSAAPTPLAGCGVATCCMRVMWRSSSRGARHQHRSAAQWLAAESGAQNGTRWRRWFKRTRVFAVEA